MNAHTESLTTTDLVAGISRVIITTRRGPVPATVTAIRQDGAHGALVSLRTEAAMPSTVTLEAATDEIWQAADLVAGERRMYAAAAAVADALLEGADTTAALQEYAVARWAFLDR